MYDPSLNPRARDFFAGEGIPLSRADRRGNAKGNCPFHPSKSGKSFSVDERSGRWYCFGCHEGGDMLRFLRKRHGWSFRQAAQSLNAWVEDGKQTPTRRRERPKSIERQLAEAVVDGPPPNLQREQRHFEEMLERIHDRQVDRAAEIRRGAAEHYDGEQDDCLELQHLTTQNLRFIGGIE